MNAGKHETIAAKALGGRSYSRPPVEDAANASVLHERQHRSGENAWQQKGGWHRARVPAGGFKDISPASAAMALPRVCWRNAPDARGSRRC